MPSDALRLFLVLKAAHDNDTGRGRDGFAIAAEAMWRNGTTPGMGRDAIAKARNMLIGLRRIELVRPARRGRVALYRFVDAELSAGRGAERGVT